MNVLICCLARLGFILLVSLANYVCAACVVLNNDTERHVCVFPERHVCVYVFLLGDGVIG